MEISLPPEREAALSQLAHQRGSDASSMVRGLVERFLDDELRFIQGVREGEAELDRGERVSLAELSAQLDKLVP